MNYYSYCINRNKGPISQSKLKKEIILEKKGVCYLCNNSFLDRKHILELEHKIPVMLGGKIFDKNNLDIICLNCHKGKTIADKRIIHSLKVLKILEGSYEMTSLFTFEELEEFYLRVFPFTFEQAKSDPWGPNPEYIRLTDNREIGEVPNETN